MDIFFNCFDLLLGDPKNRMMEDDPTKAPKNYASYKSLNWGWQPLANDLFMAYIRIIGVTITTKWDDPPSKSRQNTGNFTVGHEAKISFFKGSTKRVMMIFGNCELGLRWLAITIPTNTRASNS